MSRQMIIPEGYKSALTLRETQHAIKYIKDLFQQNLSFALTLDRVTAPLIVRKGSGINDDLNGTERKVDFSFKEIDGEAEVVQSLAKWKRMALYKYGYNVGEGIYTDMNAIRRDDDADNIHSVFVDQWDWEKVISKEERNEEFLKENSHWLEDYALFMALKDHYEGKSWLEWEEDYKTRNKKDNSRNNYLKRSKYNCS